MSEEHLLPCPFCGSAPKVFHRKAHDAEDIEDKLYWYVCSNYECGVGATHGEWSDYAARKKWNRRHAAHRDKTQ